jgi:1,4-alpha-glucan branching enzyme
VTALEVRTLVGTQRVLRIYAPAARTVEITGDFTHWQAVQLTRGSDGWWSVTRAMAPGTYQMNLRIDGGRWLAPPGLLTTSDEFGGTIGILTIE